MQHRALGQTGLEVSEIGFGTWGLGGDAYGPISMDDGVKLLHCALAHGINFFDTSDLYGKGKSELVLGKAFRKTRSKVLLATKGGMVDGITSNLTEAHLERSLNESLKRLETDYVDLYQLHGPSYAELTKNPEVFGVLDRWLKQGRVRACGISVRSPDEGLQILERFSPAVIQVNFNLVDQRAKENGLFAMAAKKKTGIIVRTPLTFGFLTGKYNRANTKGDLDHRKRWTDEQIGLWRKALEMMTEALDPEKKNSPTEIALRFCLSHPAASTAIPGMMTEDQVIENCKASRKDVLSEVSLDKAFEIYRQNTFFLKKSA